VDAVEGTLDRDMDILLVNLAICASILWVANARSVVAPPGISAVIRTSLKTAVNTAKSRFAPTRSIHAKTVIGTVVHANWDLAIGTSPERTAHASTVVALSIGQNTSISAQLH